MSDVASPALAGCIASIDQCLLLIDALDANSFRHRTETFASVGEHLRHCIDHFACFESGLAAGLVDYDARARDPEVESNPRVSRMRFTAARAFLLTIDPGALSGPLAVRQRAAADSAPVTTSSTLERELMFLSGHTLHHVALARLTAKMVGLAQVPDVGVAYSTRAFRAQQAAG